MVKIRLTRTGKKHQPRYRIVVVDSRKKRDGKYIEKLGFYNPQTDPPKIQLNKQRYQLWLKKGAQPTKTVRELYQKV